jgi:hypothetical protein
MKVEDFVAQIKSVVVEENAELYRDLFNNTSDASDPYWQRALDFYRSVDESQREVLFEVIRQVIVDTVSSVLAIVDGVSYLEGQDGDCSLTCGGDELSGELQDVFLQQFEN